MTVSTFVQPNKGTDTPSGYAARIDAAIAALAQVAASFSVHEQATPDMTVRIEAGRLAQASATPIVVAALNSGAITAPTANPRHDIVYVNADTGTVGIQTGAESASPVDPAIPARAIALARLVLATTTTAITNSLIDDLRSLNALVPALSVGTGELQGNAVTTAKIADGAVTQGKLFAPLTGRNRLKNGCCRVSQRYGTTETSTADDTYMMDCWYGLSQTGACTHQQVAPTAAVPFWNLRINQSQASAQRFGAAQIVEGKDVTDMLGQSGVFSFTCRVSDTMALRYAILEWTGAEDTVVSDVVNDWTSAAYTAGSFFNATTLNVVAVGSQTVAAATNTVAALSGTLSTSMKNVIVVVWTESAQDQHVELQIGKLQFEPGTVATTFEYEDYGATLRKCKRYLPGVRADSVVNTYSGVCMGMAISATVVRAILPFEVPARIRPTGIFGTPGGLGVNIFKVTNGSGADAGNTGTTAPGYTTVSAMLEITVGSGLTAGQGSLVTWYNSSQLLYFTGAEM